jgi:hypothetical protein
MNTQKLVVKAGTKKVDAKELARRSVMEAVLAKAFLEMEDVVVAPLTDSYSEVLVRTKDFDVVLKAVVKKERLAVEFEDGDEE